MGDSRREVKELKAALAQARAERDEALTALAVEREKANALRLQLDAEGEPPPPDYPATAGPGEPPLRYLLVDKANSSFKTILGPLHKTVKGLTRKRR